MGNKSILCQIIQKLNFVQLSNFSQTVKFILVTSTVNRPRRGGYKIEITTLMQQIEMSCKVFRDCAWASQVRSGKVLIDHSYKQAVIKQKKYCIWKENEAVWNWPSTKWLPLPEIL